MFDIGSTRLDDCHLEEPGNSGPLFRCTINAVQRNYVTRRHSWTIFHSRTHYSVSTSDISLPS